MIHACKIYITYTYDTHTYTHCKIEDSLEILMSMYVHVCIYGNIPSQKNRGIVQTI